MSIDPIYPKSSGMAGINRFDRFDKEEIMDMHKNCDNGQLKVEMIDSLGKRARGSSRACGTSKYPCPDCGVPSVAVVYGYLVGDDAGKVRAEGNVVGGCCSSSATRYCYSCDKKFVP